MKKLMKIVAIVACAAILVAGSVAGTFAWLAMKTESITNTFTAGDIEITLKNTTPSEANTKMVPGQPVAYEATVTVAAESEACWLFVKLVKSENYSTYLENYVIADGWYPLRATDANGALLMDEESNPVYVDGVYYRKVEANATNAQSFVVIKDNTLYATETAQKSDYDLLTDGNKPQLIITAYAVQYAGFEVSDSEPVAGVQEAWKIAAAINNANGTDTVPETPGSAEQSNP